MLTTPSSWTEMDYSTNFTGMDQGIEGVRDNLYVG
jgi:hypothetical protein